MIRRYSWFWASVWLLLTGGCALLPVAKPAETHRQAAYPLPNCSPLLEQADHWISQYPDPDQPLLSPAEIQKINQMVRSRQLITDIFSTRLWDYDFIQASDWPEEGNPETSLVINDAEKKTKHGGLLGGYTLYTYLKDETESIKRRPKWDPAGQVIPIEAFTALDDNLNLPGIHEDNHLRYGITRRRTDVRYYPTDMIMNGKPWERDFDVNQATSLQALEPVAILHTSRDQRWIFVVASYCRGWMKRSDLVEDCSPAEIKRVAHPERFLVVVGQRVVVQEAQDNTLTAEYFYLGACLPLTGEDAGFYQIALPAGNTAGQIQMKPMYVAKSAAVSVGYLPYTVRNLLQQVFQLSGTPYRWGGREGSWDCSQLIKDVYATMGFRLPRNSGVQALVGSQRIVMRSAKTMAERTAVLDSLTTPALLQFPGHIMLYLGKHAGHYYVIHDIWAYREPIPDKKDRVVIIGKVVVSDLSLGEGSSAKTLLERITTVNFLRP